MKLKRKKERKKNYWTNECDTSHGVDSIDSLE